MAKEEQCFYQNDWIRIMNQNSFKKDTIPLLGYILSCEYKK